MGFTIPAGKGKTILIVDVTISLKGGGPGSGFNINDRVPEWLNNEALFGGHKAANDLRYWVQSAGLVAGVTQAVPTDGGALVVLSYDLGSMSAEPVVLQQLALLKATPDLSITPLKTFTAPHGDGRGSAFALRLFPTKDGLFQYDRDAFWRVGKDGALGSLIGKGLKDMIPLLNLGRFIVFVSGDTGSNVIGCYDFKTNTAKVVFRAEALSGYMLDPKHGKDYVILKRTWGEPRTIKLLLPTGKIVPISGR
jgi:hypothetical protein